jgi:ribosomal protein S18 acetylase RimI-like enzyme
MEICPMGISIKLASKLDAEMIADLSRKTFHETFAHQNTKEDMDRFMNEQFTQAALMEEVGAKGNIFFLAFEGNETLGYVRLRESTNPTELGNVDAIEIARIYVLQSAIGKGVGKELMLESISIAHLMGKHAIWLGVWEHNQHAINFYQKFGFEKFGEHDFLLGNDVQTDWLMKKHL